MPISAHTAPALDVGIRRPFAQVQEERTYASDLPRGDPPMPTVSPPRWTWSRRFVAAAMTVPASIVWTHGLAALLRTLGSAEAPLAAWGLTLLAAATSLLAAFWMPRAGLLVGTVAAIWGAVSLTLVVPGSWAGAIALAVVVPVTASLAQVLAAKIPGRLDHFVAARPLLAGCWAVLAVLGAVQTARLATTITDPSIPFILTTTNPFWAGHQCLPAYLYPAELAAQGAENVYASHHYPALDAGATPATGLDMTIEDPFQYPPQFLLLPTLALRLTQDFATLRIVWFALQMTLYTGAFLALARWIGGRAGRLAAWMLPITLAAFPMLHNFQFGQFHLPAIALALLAMCSFAAHRHATGGLLLAVAVLAKVFPVVLIPMLLAARRWKAMVWTAAWGAAATVLAVLVLGTAPFIAFWDYQLPRLADGSAFAFDEAWPEISGLVIADNQGVYGLVRKLGGSKTVAGGVGRIFLLGVLGLSAVVGLRSGRPSRWSRATSWLGLLGLGSLASAGAWGDYVPATAVWLLALLIAIPLASARWRLAFGTIAVLEWFLLGTMPIGEWAPPAVMVPIAGLGSIAMLALFLAATVRPAESWMRAPSAADLSETTGELEAVPAAEASLRTSPR
jgi:hypothetical protein